MADKLTFSLGIRKRWFFYPVVTVLALLGRLGILRDIDKVSKWIARHAFVIKTSDGGRVNL